MTVTALTVARERELGTFEQLLVSPLRPFEILVGKTVPPLLIGLVHATIYVGAAVFVFQLPLVRSLALPYPSLIVCPAALTGAGLFIPSLAQTQQQPLLVALRFPPPPIPLSGF